MAILALGAIAPPIGTAPLPKVHAVVFFKVTCEVCQMAAPSLATLHAAYGDHVVSIGQDPAEKLAAFKGDFGWGIPATPDLSPYLVSDAYGIEAVPTTFLIEGDVVIDVVESWDRDGLNRVSERLAAASERPFVAVSVEGDGLPAFRPG